MATTAEITAAAVKLIAAADKYHDIVHGADNATVETDAGDLPTFAKVIADLLALFPSPLQRTTRPQDGLTSGVLFQGCVVTLDNDDKELWVCADAGASTWIPVSGGLVKNADQDLYQRIKASGDAGEEISGVDELLPAT